MLNNQLTKKYPSENILLIFILSFLSLFYFIFGQNFIPMRFKFDSHAIREGMFDPLLVDKSYRQVSNLLTYVGLNFYTPMIVMNIISWCVFVLILITIVRINKTEIFHNYQILLLFIFMIMYGFYFSNYSKDIIILIFFMIAVNLPPIHKNLLINIILAIFIYGYFFRTYWLLVGTISLIPLIIRNVNLKKDLFYIFIITVILIIMFNFVKHAQITNMRIQINQSRMGQANARSMIRNIVNNSSIYTDIINYVYCLITLFIPIQGFSSINMIIYYIWIISILIFCFKHRRHINLKLVLILLIYINVQALFEPDFGSVFRHQLAWFIVLYESLCLNTNNNYLSKKYNYDEN